jgi:hypothetical protein
VTFRVKSSTTTGEVPSATSGKFAVWKPARLAATLYVPASSRGKLNDPVSLVTVLERIFVLRSVVVTVTPGIAIPV